MVFKRYTESKIPNLFWVILGVIALAILLMGCLEVEPEPFETAGYVGGYNLTVELQSPANASNETIYGLSFIAKCETNGSITGANLWLWYYENASIIGNYSNTTDISNNTNFSISFSPGVWLNYTWNIECLNNTHSANASSNRTIFTYDTEGALDYYPASTTGFEVDCYGLDSYDLLYTPENQTNSTALMVFNNSGLYSGQLNMSVNSSPYNLEFYASQDDNYSNSVQVTATGNATINESVGIGESILLWWWVNCSNASVTAFNETQVFINFEWWFE